MPKKPEPKHPRDMTTDEAMAHLFHPKIVEHAKKEAGKAEKSTEDKDK